MVRTVNHWNSSGRNAIGLKIYGSLKKIFWLSQFNVELRYNEIICRKRHLRKPVRSKISQITPNYRYVIAILPFSRYKSCITAFSGFPKYWFVGISTAIHGETLAIWGRPAVEILLWLTFVKEVVQGSRFRVETARTAHIKRIVSSPFCSL